MLSVLLFLMMPQMAYSSTTIIWKEQAVVTGPTMTLGDLADLSGDDPARVAVLQTVSMGEVPGPGQTRYLTGDILLARLTFAGINPDTEGWLLPDNIFVTTLSQTISKERMNQEMAEALIAMIPYPKEDVTIQLRGVLTDINIPVGGYQIRAKFPNGIRYTGPTQAIAEIWVNNRPVKSIYLVYDVQVLVDAYIIKGHVPAHQFLTEEDLVVEKRSLAKLPLRAVKDMAIISTYWTRRTLSPGTVLTEDMLDIPPAAKRNNQVTIIIDTNGIMLTTYGLALQDGRPGDIIRVRNIETKRIIMTKVQPNGTVVPLGL